jgi:DNA-binding LacI/PurR family transcriptional regulator
MSIVDIDPFCSAELAVDYFKSKKLKKVNIFTDPRLAYYNRGTIFAQYWKNAGGECELFVGRDVEVEFNNKEGYFFTSDNLLYDYSCRYEKEHGVQLAKKFIVLGVDGKNLIFPNFHKFPTIATDWRVIGKYAIEECMYRIKELGSRPKRIYVPGDLIVNQ